MASDNNYVLPPEAEEPKHDALAFVHDRALLIQRFLLAELLAVPVSLRKRRAATPRLGMPSDRERR